MRLAAEGRLSPWHGFFSARGLISKKNTKEEVGGGGKGFAQVPYRAGVCQRRDPKVNAGGSDGGKGGDSEDWRQLTMCTRRGGSTEGGLVGGDVRLD